MRSGRRHIAWLLLVLIGAIAPVAADIGVRSSIAGLLVRESAGRIDGFINGFAKKRGFAADARTNVVPVMVGERCVGAAQVSGSAADLAMVKSVGLREAKVHGRYARVLVPDFGESRVAVSAVIDVVPKGNGGVLKVADRGSLDAVLDRVSGISGPTRIVPTVGAHAGDVQVLGPAASVERVKAVFAYEESLDDGKYRVKIFVPSSSDVRPVRVSGVGVSAMVDSLDHVSHAY